MTIQATATRRAADDDRRWQLVRRGTLLCLAAGARSTGSRTAARTFDHDIGSAGRARVLEQAFHEWIERVPDLARAPIVALGMVLRFAEHLDGLRAEFDFQVRAEPRRPLAASLKAALVVHEAGLRVAYRRMGQRWGAA